MVPTDWYANEYHELLGREITNEEITILVDKCSRGGTITLGALEVLDTKWRDSPLLSFEDGQRQVVAYGQESHEANKNERSDNCYFNWTMNKV